MVPGTIYSDGSEWGARQPHDDVSPDRGRVPSVQTGHYPVAPVLAIAAQRQHDESIVELRPKLHFTRRRPANRRGDGRCGAIGGQGRQAGLDRKRRHRGTGNLLALRGIEQLQFQLRGTVHEMTDDELRLVAELAISADADMLTVCRMVLAGVAEGGGMSDDALDDAKLVLSELCADAIDHASRPDVGVEVAFHTSPTELEVTVSDHRADPVTAPVGGAVGLALLRQLCSRLEVTARSDGPGAVVRFAYALPA